VSQNRFQIITETLRRRQPDLTVFMDEVHKPHNLAAIVRTCDAVGIGEVHSVYPHGKVRIGHGTAMGSNRWVKTTTYPNLEAGLLPLKAQGMQVLAAHFSERAVDFRSIDYTRPTVVLVGAEKLGVSEKAAELADQHVLIPMLGMVQSLNVSVATAIILYEAQRQREAAGLYQKSRLPKETFERLLFEWYHPKVAAFCQQKGLAYPKLDEQGNIRDPQWDERRQNLE